MTSDSDEIRLIKKYPNRRLYDTQESRYITLDDALKMVMDNIPFKVVDQKTGEDLTRSILLQIIMEQEHSSESPFNTEILSEFIRNYSETSRQNFSSFLQASMKLFGEQQAALMKHMSKSMKTTPVDFWVDLTRQNLQNMQQIQDQFFKAKSSGNSEKE